MSCEIRFRNLDEIPLKKTKWNYDDEKLKI